MITVANRTVFACKCDRPKCRYEWDTFVKPGRCAKCKRVSWNSEDYRSSDPFQGVRTGLKIPTGAKAPASPSYANMLDAFTQSRAIIDQLVNDYGPCDHPKNQCVCKEKQTLALIDRQIKKLKAITEYGEESGNGKVKVTEEVSV